MTKAKSCIAILLVVVFAGCSRDLVTGKKSYNWFTIQDDIKLGNQVIHEQLKSLQSDKKPFDAQITGDKKDGEMWQKIQRVTGRIAAVSHYPSFPYEAHYADVDIVNAWCAPGGKVMVYSGLFDPKKGLVDPKSEDELAAVLGHEIAHANARHVSKSLSRNYTIMVAGQLAVSAISASGTGVMQDAFNRTIVEGINLYIPFYSRSNESEADKIGIIYMAKAGYDPHAAVNLWYRACKKRGEPYDLYASHPPSCERAKTLEALLPQAMEEYRKSTSKK